MSEIEFLPASEIQRIALDLPEGTERLELVAEMCRFNTLALMKQMGLTGEGAGVDLVDLLTYLFYFEMNTLSVGKNNPDSDIYLSSRKLLVPGYYAVMYGLGLLSQDQFLNQGLPGTASETGDKTATFQDSVSNALEIARAKQQQKHGGRVFFMTSAQEWAVNQNVESLEPAVRQQTSNLYVLVNHKMKAGSNPAFRNESLLHLESAVSVLGWQVAQCDGNDYAALAHVFEKFRRSADKPKLVLAATDESDLNHRAALLERIQSRIAENELEPVLVERVTFS